LSGSRDRSSPAPIMPPEARGIAFSSAAEAVAEAWSVMGSGATGLYIYDVNTYEAYFPMSPWGC
jgi:hypothetical protein